MNIIETGIMIILMLFLNIGNGYSNKRFQLIAPAGEAGYAFYSIVTSVSAMIIFAFFGKFNLVFDSVMFLFAVIFALVCIMSHVFNLLSLKYNGIFMSSLFNRSGGILIPFILSIVLFSEKTTVFSALGAALILFAAMYPQFNSFKTGKNVFAAIGLFVIAGSSPVVLKLYTRYKLSEDLYSYFFLTNLFIFVFAAIYFLIKTITSKNSEILRKFKMKHYAFVMLNTFFGNVSTLVTTILIASIPLISYTLLENTCSVVAMIIISSLFKEKITKRYIVSAALSIFAVLLTII